MSVLYSYLRGGTAVPEFTMLNSSNYSGNNRDSNVNVGNDSPLPTTSSSNQATGDYPINIMNLEPSSDHSLAYLVLEEGVSYVVLALYTLSVLNV